MDHHTGERLLENVVENRLTENRARSLAHSHLKPQKPEGPDEALWRQPEDGGEVEEAHSGQGLSVVKRFSLSGTSSVKENAVRVEPDRECTVSQLSPHRQAAD
jgi:hypothetical protein